MSKILHMPVFEPVICETLDGTENILRNTRHDTCIMLDFCDNMPII